MSTFGMRLRQLRKEKNISLEKLAEEINSTKATLCRYENSKRVPKIEFASAIADYFGVSTDYLLGTSHFDKAMQCLAEKAGISPSDSESHNIEVDCTFLEESLSNDDQILMSKLAHELGKKTPTADVIRKMLKNLTE